MDTRQEVTIPAGSVAEGVSYRRIGTKPVFLVRTGDQVEALIGRSTHLSEQLHWCVREKLFFDPRIGGDRFDVHGRKVAGSGPAPRDLDRLSARLEGADVVIRTNPVEPGLDVGRGGGRGVSTTEWGASGERGRVCSEAVPPYSTGRR